jgi:predicted AAA+ superfamily ATPase
VDKRKIIEIAFCGGYPEPLMFIQKERRDWFKDYLNDVLIKDIRDVTEIRKTEHLQSLAKALFSHSAQFFYWKTWQPKVHYHVRLYKII